MKTDLLDDTGTQRTARHITMTPAFWCALIGAISLLIEIWVLSRWATAGVHSTLYPGDSISTARTASIWAVQVALVIAAATCVIYLIRDCRRREHLTLDAGMFLGFFLASWQSPLFNYRDITLVVNQHLLHVNSWGPYIPGWDPPHRELQIEAPIAVTGIGFGLLILWVWLQAWMARKIADRFPDWSWGRLVAAIFIAGLLADVLIESAWLNTGVYSHAHAWRPATLFAGHWYNLPLSAVLIASVFTTPFVIMRHLEHTRGARPWIYRGAELAATPTASNVVRALAAIGAANIATFVYLAWFIFCAGFGGPMPTDTPTYMWPIDAR